MKNRFTISTVLLVAILAGSVWAQDPLDDWAVDHYMMEKWGMPPGGAGQYGWNQESLTEAQGIRLDQLQMEFFDHMAALEDRLWGKLNERENHLNNTDLDVDAVMSLQKDIRALQNQMMNMRISFEREVREYFPDELYGNDPGGWGNGSNMGGNGDMMGGGGMGGYRN